MYDSTLRIDLPSGGAPCRVRLPGLRVVSAHDGRAERRVRALADRAARAARALSDLAFGEVRSQGELSGGERQRVGLARALAQPRRACCCSTSRCRHSTRTRALRSGSSSRRSSTTRSPRSACYARLPRRGRARRARSRGCRWTHPTGRDAVGVDRRLRLMHSSRASPGALTRRPGHAAARTASRRWLSTAVGSCTRWTTQLGEVEVAVYPWDIDDIPGRRSIAARRSITYVGPIASLVVIGNRARVQVGGLVGEGDGGFGSSASSLAGGRRRS